MATIKQVKVNNTNYNIEGQLLFIPDSAVTKTAGSSTTDAYLATKLSVANVAGITAPTDGLTFAIRLGISGTKGGIVLSIDGGKTYYPLVYNANSVITTQYGVGSTLIVSFNSTQTATTYLTTGTQSTVIGCWQVGDVGATQVQIITWEADD